MVYIFLSNFLEPVAYLVFFIAIFLEHKRQQITRIKVLLLHYLLATLFMLYAAIKAYYDQDNRWVYTVVCLQSAIAVCYYFHNFFSGGNKKLLIKCLFGINVAYFLISNIILGGISQFDSIGYAILSATVSVIGFVYFYDVLKNVRIRQYDFNFYLVSVYLVYFLVSFAIFLTYHNLTNRILDTYTLEERKLLTVLWGAHNIMLFLSAMITLMGSLWITYRNR